MGTATKSRSLFFGGYVDCPVLISHYSEGFHVCRERDKPVVCKLPSGKLGRYFPSGRLEALAVERRHEAVRLIVLLEPGVWLCRGEGGDPPRTLREDFAARWRGPSAAKGALTRARRFRRFAHAEILPADPEDA